MSEKLDRLVLEARQAADKRAEGYREKALKIYPWICGSGTRETTTANVRQRQLEATQGNVSAKQPGKAATHSPFAALGGLLKKG